MNGGGGGGGAEPPFLSYSVKVCIKFCIHDDIYSLSECSAKLEFKSQSTFVNRIKIGFGTQGDTNLLRYRMRSRYIHLGILPYLLHFHDHSSHLQYLSRGTERL